MKKQLKAIVCIVIVVVVVAGSAFVLKKAYNNYLYSTYPIKYKEEVNAASEKYDISQALIYAVIKTESSFEPNARSHAGAVGLMQLTEDTFIWLQTFYKDENDYTFDDLADPAVNIDYGVHLLSILSDMYSDEQTMLCAYNAGLGNVDEWLQDPQYSDDGVTLKKVPFPETDNYRKIVLQNESAYHKLYFSKSQ
ncbi:MAG: lytic transglycosylase domain-containing protein [Clostridia bacterium]|nr:lytic transglycosylase domain-containing protein [Clostridia bacterium]